MDFKKILIPLDGSRLSARALDMVEPISGPETQITLLSVIDPPDFMTVESFPGQSMSTASSLSDSIVSASTEMSGELQTKAGQYLNHLAERLRVSGHPTNVIVEIGDPARIIVEVADQIKPDIIVMSTHGRSGITRWLLGSVTQKVLGMTQYPVLVIPNPQK
ncbi:MAG: universal stress protein [Chloroflexi bacterium]|nr:universal stress protein [Chloroflexota bacterium]